MEVYASPGSHLLGSTSLADTTPYPEARFLGFSLSFRARLLFASYPAPEPALQGVPTRRTRP